MSKRKTADDDDGVRQQDHLNDLAKDYLYCLSQWVHTKKELISLYNDIVTINDQMVCHNCREVVDINQEIATKKLKSGKIKHTTWINPHIKSEPRPKKYNFTCEKQTYNDMFRKWGEIMKENGEYASQDEYDDIFAGDNDYHRDNDDDDDDL